MTWSIRSFCTSLLNALQAMFMIFVSNFLGYFGINIGADFPTADTEKSLSAVLSSFINGSDPGDLFDIIFPASAFKDTMIVFALALSMILTLLMLLEASVSPHSKDHPLDVVGRFILADVGIMFSYQLFIIAEYFFNSVYIKFQKVCFSNAVLNTKVTKDSLVGMQTKKDAAKSIYDNSSVAESVNKASNKLFDPDQIPSTLAYSKVPKADLGTTAEDHIKATSPSGMGEYADKLGDQAKDNNIITLALTLICLVALAAIMICFIKLLLEMTERYVLLGVMFYTAPLPFASIVMKESRIFKSWCQMFVSQVILMILNGFFISTCLGAMVRFSNSKQAMFDEMNPVTYIVFLLCLVSWLAIGSRMDQHLSALGLSTAQAGGNLAGAIMAAGQQAMLLGRTVGSMNRGVRNMAKNASSVGKAIGKNSGAKIGSGLFGRGGSAVTTGDKAVSKIKDDLSKNGNGAAAKFLAANEGKIDKKGSHYGNGMASLKMKDGGRAKFADQRAFDKMDPQQKAMFGKMEGGGYMSFQGEKGKSNETLRELRSSMLQSPLQSANKMNMISHPSSYASMKTLSGDGFEMAYSHNEKSGLGNFLSVAYSPDATSPSCGALGHLTEDGLRVCGGFETVMANGTAMNYQKFTDLAGLDVGGAIPGIEGSKVTIPENASYMNQLSSLGIISYVNSVGNQCYAIQDMSAASLGIDLPKYSDHFTTSGGADFHTLTADQCADVVARFQNGNMQQLDMDSVASRFEERDVPTYSADQIEGHFTPTADVIGSYVIDKTNTAVDKAANSAAVNQAIDKWADKNASPHENNLL